jgi:hypothetical protein
MTHLRGETGDIGAFTLVVSEDVDWYQRQIFVDGNPVTVRVGTTRALPDIALPHAAAICDASGELAADLRRFKAAEAERQPASADEIQKLEIDTIDFVNPRRPDTGEVSFTALSGGECWTCLLVRGRLCDLLMEG